MLCGAEAQITRTSGVAKSRLYRPLSASRTPSPRRISRRQVRRYQFRGTDVEQLQLDTLRMLAIGGLETETPSGEWSVRVVGTVIPEESGSLQLALAQAGNARLTIDGAVVLDGFANPAPPGGSEFFGQASQDLLADVTFERGVPAEFVVEFASANAHLGGFRVGFRTPDTDALLERAAIGGGGCRRGDCVCRHHPGHGERRDTTARTWDCRVDSRS